MNLILSTTLLIFAIFPLEALCAPITNEDIKWLNRITYGIDTQTIENFQDLGRQAFLAQQLDRGMNEKLPPQVQKIISDLQIEQVSPEMLSEHFQEQNQIIKKLPKNERISAHNEQKAYAKEIYEEAVQRHLLRALYSQAQIKEQLTWFWLNHFNIFQGKGPIRWLISDYEESAIRPHVLGKFRDLLMATLQHPAMLIYLDNSHNAANKINENYARELMELHTLGIEGGYSQLDIEALTKVLTGAGVNFGNGQTKLGNKLMPYYRRNGSFEFNPKRHDFSQKQFLGEKIAGEGFVEIEKIVDILARHPSTAKFISYKLAVYFVSDTPSSELIEKMAKTFKTTDGDISATLMTLFESKEFTASLGSKIRDPIHYVLASLRFAFDKQTISYVDPINKWLKDLGEPLYGHLTPDGYGMTEKDWISPAQLTKHFETAKQIVNNNDISSSISTSLKETKLSSTPLFQKIEPILSNQTKLALRKAVTPSEWNTLLLSAPEFLYR